MNFKTKTLCLFLLTGFLQSYANEPVYHQTLLGKVFGWTAQSKPVYLFDKHVTSRLRGYMKQFLSDELASQEYQDLGKEAQLAVGIPEDHLVPIKKIPPTSPFAVAGALAESDALYVNEEKLNQRPYGAKRCALFHEAIHMKYNDSSVDILSELGAVILSAACTHKLIKAINPTGLLKVLYGIGPITSGITAAIIVATRFAPYRESRADTQGHYATQCAMCVQESADVRRKQEEQSNSLLKNNSGYLTADELEKIAHNLAQDNKVCLHHQNKDL